MFSFFVALTGKLWTNKSQSWYRLESKFAVIENRTFLGLADQELTCMLRKDQARQCPYVFNRPTLAWRTAERGRGIEEEEERAWKQSSVPKVEWLCGNGRNYTALTSFSTSLCRGAKRREIRADQRWGEWFTNQWSQRLWKNKWCYCSPWRTVSFKESGQHLCCCLD